MLDAGGNTTWQGYAYGVEHAEERCFFDEMPGSLERYTLQRWGTVSYSKSVKGKGWVTIYKDECLALG